MASQISVNFSSQQPCEADWSLSGFYHWRMQPLRKDVFFFSNHFLNTFTNSRWCIAAPLTTWKLWILGLSQLHLADTGFSPAFCKAVVTFLTVGPNFSMRPILLGSDTPAFGGHCATHRWTPWRVGRPLLEKINCQLSLHPLLMKQSYLNVRKMRVSLGAGCCCRSSRRARKGKAAARHASDLAKPSGAVLCRSPLSHLPSEMKRWWGLSLCTTRGLQGGLSL